jgi:hypothetical protein
MQFIDENGKIVNGTPLTDEQAAVITEIVDNIYPKSGIYLSMEQRRSFAVFMVQNFRIYRKVSDEVINDAGPVDMLA